jgi:hypothetical protein
VNHVVNKSNAAFVRAKGRRVCGKIRIFWIMPLFTTVEQLIYGVAQNRLDAAKSFEPRFVLGTKRLAE